MESDYRTFLVRVDLSEVIDLDLEGLLDLMAERAGNEVLMDISYKIVGHEDDTLLIAVTGDDSKHREECEE